MKFMSLLLIMTTPLFAQSQFDPVSPDSGIPLHERDFRVHPQEFEDAIEGIPRATMSQVGAVYAPLPDHRGFLLPGRWRPVKMINDTAVYVVKDAYQFLQPNVNDPTRRSYLLWTKLNGEQPEILIWNCPPQEIRDAIVADIERRQQEREAANIRRNQQMRVDQERKNRERQLRAQARQAVRSQQAAHKLAVSNARHPELVAMQAPLADAVVDRISVQLHNEGAVQAFSTDEQQALRQQIRAVMAMQIQMRDLDWCNAIEHHMAPNMWDTAREDVLKSTDPQTVVRWLAGEVERQAQQAEIQVEYAESERELGGPSRP